MVYSQLKDEREIGSDGEIRYNVSLYSSELTKEQRDLIMPMIEQIKGLLDAEKRIEREDRLNAGKIITIEKGGKKL